MLIDVDVLLEYTDWERQKWRESLRKHGDRIPLARIAILVSKLSAI
jgi:hypothetical protein